MTVCNKPTIRMMTGFIYLRFAMVIFTLAFLQNLCSVGSSNINQQSSFTKKDYCQGTQKTLQEVDTCPENEKKHLERSNTLQCDSYSSCQGEPLVYHCVRSKGDYVEVCSPRTKIIGGFCAKFDKNVGRVVEDSSRICPECPKNYDSDDYFKYSSCVTTRMTSAFKQSTENAKISHTLSRAPTDDAHCDGQSCSSEPSRASTATSDQSQGKTESTTTNDYNFISMVLTILMICLVGLFLNGTMARKVERSEETTPLLQQKEEVKSQAEIPGGGNDNTRKQDECLDEKNKSDKSLSCENVKDPAVECDDVQRKHSLQILSEDHEITSNKRILKECVDEKDQSDKTLPCENVKDPALVCEDNQRKHSLQNISADHEIISNKTKQEEYLDGKDQSDKIISCESVKAPAMVCEEVQQKHSPQNPSENHETTSNKACIAEALQKCDDKRIEKPLAMEIKSDSVRLLCNTLGAKPDHYQVRYKTKKENSKWKSIETDSGENNITISELMANTVYIFQVRGIFGDEEGPFSPVTEEIETKKSLATTLLRFCDPCDDKNCPPIYLLPVEENALARNDSAKTRQLVLGAPSRDFNDEKTIMLVGATGSGKSTLVDGIVNYIMGVSFDDPFRFTIVTLEDEEKKAKNNQAISQTEWITVYKIYPTDGGRLQYTLNIIDTPGFGDTRGIERDNVIVDQIRQLFSAQGCQGVLDIDAVCFIVKAPDARLTVVQQYIFSSIMSLFGKDIESNICTLITFADGANPPVIASLNESKLPFGSKFNFNNSALFAENKNLIQNMLSPMFWKMGCSSFESFFKHVEELKTQSLRQTKSVLDEREHLKTVILNIRPQVTAGLSKLSQLQTQLNTFETFKNEIKSNEKFEYEEEEIIQVMTDLPKGKHVTNCINCNVTCHKYCSIPDDNNKRYCAAMNYSTGKCDICPEKCNWDIHKNTPYVIEYIPKKVKKTYAEMKKRYEEAIGRTLTHEKYIEELTFDLEDMFEEIKAMMDEMNKCKSRLKEIALKPDPLSTLEHINLMIQSEETEKKQGYFNRIQMLKEFQRMALVEEDVANFGQNIEDTRETIKTLTGKVFPKRTPDKENRKNILVRSYECVIAVMKKKITS